MSDSQSQISFVFSPPTLSRLLSLGIVSISIPTIIINTDSNIVIFVSLVGRSDRWITLHIYSLLSLRARFNPVSIPGCLQSFIRLCCLSQYHSVSLF